MNLKIKFIIREDKLFVRGFDDETVIGEMQIAVDDVYSVLIFDDIRQIFEQTFRRQLAEHNES